MKRFPNDPFRTLVESPPASRLPSLDGLRAVAILIVLLSHAAPTAGFPPGWDAFITEGALGVRCFFVISGFLITLLLLKEERSRGHVSLRAFYWRRSLRILPVLWVYLLVLPIMKWGGFIHLSSYDLLAPLTFTVSFPFWKHPTGWVTSHTWSLCIEEHFYLVWPVLFVSLAKWIRPMMVTTILIASPLLRLWCRCHPRHMWLTYIITGHADMIGWGCLLALCYENHPNLLEKIVNWRPAIGRIAAVVLIAKAPHYFVQWFDIYAFGPLMSLQAMLIAYLIASLILVRRGMAFSLLNHRILIGIGTISYSLYIWQQVFLYPPGGDTTPASWQHWPANLLLAVGCAMTSFFLIERPLARFKHMST